MGETNERDVEDQKRIILGRTTFLVNRLTEALARANSFDETLEPVKDFYIAVCEEYPAYVRKVMLSPSNPSPCPPGQIWCLPRMRCTRLADCNDGRID